MKWKGGEGESLRPGYFSNAFFYGLAELFYINFRTRHIHVYLRSSFQHSVFFNISEISQLFTKVSKFSPIGNVAIVKPFACILPKARQKRPISKTRRTPSLSRRTRCQSFDGFPRTSAATFILYAERARWQIAVRSASISSFTRC